jgi:predicted transcriptional regulator
MTKQTIASLTRKGYSQKKIAKTLGIRKMKVVTYQKTHRIGKRVVGGAREFWKDVKRTKEMKGISRGKAIKEVKYSKLWFEKRQARLKGVAKARDEMFQKWYKIKTGEIEKDWWKEEKGEELMEAAEYD